MEELQDSISSFLFKKNGSVYPMQKALCSAVVEVFTVKNDSALTKECCGVACLVKDHPQKSYYIQVFDMKSGETLFELRLDRKFEIHFSRTDFIALAGGTCQTGFNFACDEEAEQFFSKTNELLEKQQKIGGLRNFTSGRGHSYQDMRKQKTVINLRRGVLPKADGEEGGEEYKQLGARPKSSRPRAVTEMNPVDLPSETYQHRFRAVTTPTSRSSQPMATVEIKSPEINNACFHSNTVQINNTVPSSFSWSKGKSKGKSKRKADIGAPTNFQHIGHVGWDPDKGFDVNNLDPELKNLFDACGISEAQLKDKETSKVIYDLIEEKGGVEAVKREFRQLAPPPPDVGDGTAPPPTPPPRRTSGSHPPLNKGYLYPEQEEQQQLKPST